MVCVPDLNSLCDGDRLKINYSVQEYFNQNSTALPRSLTYKII